jgi:hypothetical protein
MHPRVFSAFVHELSKVAANVAPTNTINSVGWDIVQKRFVSLEDRKPDGHGGWIYPNIIAMQEGKITKGPSGPRIDDLSQGFKVRHDVQRLHERLHDQGWKIPHAKAQQYLDLEHTAAQTPGGLMLRFPSPHAQTNIATEMHAPVWIEKPEHVLGNLAWSHDPKTGKGVLSTFRDLKMKLRSKDHLGRGVKSVPLSDLFKEAPQLLEHKELRKAARRFLQGVATRH